MEDIKIKSIERIGDDSLKFTWYDGFEAVLSLKTFRDKCPCAECTSAEEKKSPLAKFVLNNLQDYKYILEKLEPMGNYAVKPIWKDGHDAGIYRYEYIRELCEQNKK